MKLIIIGILLILGSIWGGAIALHYITATIFSLAAAITACLIFVTGFTLVAYGIDSQS